MEQNKIFETASSVWKMEAYSINRLSEVACPQTIIQIVEALAGCISNKKRVIATGFGHSGIAARHMMFNMYMLNGCASYVSPEESPRQVQTLNKGDILIIISKSGCNEDLLKLIKQAHDREVTVIGITQNPASPLGMGCDIMLRILVVRNTQHTDTMSLTGSVVLQALLDGITVAVQQELRLV
ncbi:MAG: MurR/RpiR family transcriptional regulator [Christensenellales bacterium]|jgi:D-arabinose 5-phosphate isomerase GutQ